MPQNRKRLTFDDFINRANAIHGNGRYDYSKVIFKSTKQPVIITCNICKYEFSIKPAEHFRYGCKKCAVKTRKRPKVIKKRKFYITNNDDFLKYALECHGDNLSYLNKYTNSESKINVKCNICNLIFQKSPYALSRGSGCTRCSIIRKFSNVRLSVEEYEFRCKAKYGNKYTYFQDYVRGSDKIQIYCHQHNGIFYQYASDHLYKGTCCKECQESKGVKYIKEYLQENNIGFIEEFSFDGCKFKYKLRFDFYLPNWNCCIEYDGAQHFRPIDIWGGEKEFQDTKTRDSIKTDYCNSNNIYLIRIPYTVREKAKEVLDLKLKELFPSLLERVV